MDGKYAYNHIETGSYAWNETAKTVTLKPETTEYNAGVLLTESEYRTAFIEMMTTQLAAMPEDEKAAILEQALAAGYTSLDEYMEDTVDYQIEFFFGVRAYNYSFSDDGAALFLVQPLPANNGTNELTGQTYYGMKWDNIEQDDVKDETQSYVFTDNTYTLTLYGNWVITGSYAYDGSIMKRVWLNRNTVDGKTRAQMYADMAVTEQHNYADDYAYRAAKTNSQFRTSENIRYDNVNKTIR
ncbi:MAG: hypothetical protein LBU99_05590 [Spirochaetaceae bacterium]|nr:hypothetical protein [Spirochaetaceae bacterium]